MDFSGSTYNNYRRRSCVPVIQEDASRFTDTRPRSNSFANGDKTPYFSSRCRDRCPTPFNITPKISFTSFTFDSPIDMLASPRRKLRFKFKVTAKSLKVLFMVLAIAALVTMLTAFTLAIQSYYEEQPELLQIFNSPPQQFDEEKYFELSQKSGKLMKFKPQSAPADLEEAENLVEEEETNPWPSFPIRNIPIITGKISNPSNPGPDESPYTEVKRMTYHESDVTSMTPKEGKYLQNEDLVEGKMLPTQLEDPLRATAPPPKRQSIMKILSNSGPPKGRFGGQQGQVREIRRNSPPGINPKIYFKTEL